DALVLEPGELVARQPAGGELLHPRDQLGRPGNAADGFRGNGHRARLSAGVAMSMALAPVLGLGSETTERLQESIWGVGMRDAGCGMGGVGTHLASRIPHPVQFQ